jgi:REP element-mobilizing transposase RayT
MIIVPRKEIRLSRDEYVGKRIYFLTICAEQPRSIFLDSARAKIAIEELRKVAGRMNVLVHAFCVMPHHVHLLVEGRTAQSDIVKFVGQWKQSTGYVFRANFPRGFGNAGSTITFSAKRRIRSLWPGTSG